MKRSVSVRPGGRLVLEAREPRAAAGLERAVAVVVPAEAQPLAIEGPPEVGVRPGSGRAADVAGGTVGEPGALADVRLGLAVGLHGLVTVPLQPGGVGADRAVAADGLCESVELEGVTRGVGDVARVDHPAREAPGALVGIVAVDGVDVVDQLEVTPGRLVLQTAGEAEGAGQVVALVDGIVVGAEALVDLAVAVVVDAVVLLGGARVDVGVVVVAVDGVGVAVAVVVDAVVAVVALVAVVRRTVAVRVVDGGGVGRTGGEQAQDQGHGDGTHGVLRSGGLVTAGVLGALSTQLSLPRGESRGW